MADRDQWISDEEMANLPDDDELAFVAYERMIRPITRNRAPTEEGTSLEREYVNHILAFIKLSNLDIPVQQDPPFGAVAFWNWYEPFLQVIDYHIVKFRLAHARGMDSAVATVIHLSQDYRTEIHKLLNRIRKVVNATDLPDAKKDAIYDKITALQLEVDKSKTRFDAFLARWLDLTNAAAEGAENLEPAVKLLDRVMRILGRAKADHDAGKLPAPEETKKLPGPNTERSPGPDLDDEIPF